MRLQSFRQTISGACGVADWVESEPASGNMSPRQPPDVEGLQEQDGSLSQPTPQDPRGWRKLSGRC